MKPFTKYGGIVASIILIAFGIGSIVDGRQRTLRGPQHAQAGADRRHARHGQAIANKPVDTGAKAKLFAAGIRKHTLEATGGQLYSQMGQFLTPAGKQTSDAKAAAIDKTTGKPVPNAARNIWVTETALSTALSTSFFAESVAKFAIVMGFALLLAGIGFLVLVFRLPLEAAASPRAAARRRRRSPPAPRPLSEPVARPAARTRGSPEHPAARHVRAAGHLTRRRRQPCA